MHRDGTKSAREHVALIKDICGLFRLPGISEHQVKRKLLYLSLSGNARIWLRYLDEKVTIEWSVFKKVLFLKYFTPKEAYGNHCYIINFWPHLGESNTQAWGRLKELLRKNPSHGLSKSIILIKFYVRVPPYQKDFLDNSSGGRFTHKSMDEAWDSLETIFENTDNWDLDKGDEPRLEYEDACVENFSTSP